MSNDREKLADDTLASFIEGELNARTGRGLSLLFKDENWRQIIAALRSPRAEPGRDAVQAILTEVKRARLKHPNWPQDSIHAAAVVSEESGELMRAAVQHQLNEGGTLEACKLEAVQTAAVCIRFLEETNRLKSSPPSDTVEVPKEPTEEMLRAGVKAIHGGAVYRCVTTGGTDTMELDLVTGYRAMLAACKKG